MSLLSPPVQAVLELFQGPLAEVRFADVDAAVLSNLAATVEAAAVAVAEQEAQLSELRQTLADRQDALALLAQRALAYARVYAEHDEALTEQLTRITLPRASKPRKVSAKAGGAEPSAIGSEVSALEAPSTEATSVFTGEEAADPSMEASAFEAPSPEAPDPDAPDPDAPDPDVQPARKGKRRSNSTRDEAQSRPA